MFARLPVPSYPNVQSSHKTVPQSIFFVWLHIGKEKGLRQSAPTTRGLDITLQETRGGGGGGGCDRRQ